MLRPVRSVNVPNRTVNLPKAQRLLNRIIIRKPLLACTLHREHKTDLLRRPVIFQKPATPNRPRRSIKNLTLKSFFFHIIIIHLSRIFKSRIHRAAFCYTPFRKKRAIRTSPSCAAHSSASLRNCLRRCSYPCRRQGRVQFHNRFSKPVIFFIKD